ncbi:hypothetical protein QUF80_04490 [Desulfococcaceae bacterium HSG8]|nr:hypothetical protein [Desulfococcaceae bacterium HSG8]
MMNYIVKSGINKIASEFGSHPNSDATSDTVNALIYALKDVITWFGNIY